MQKLISKMLIFLSKQSSDVFWIRNIDYTEQIYINPAYETVWQRNIKEIYDHPEKWLSYIYPEDRIKLQESIRRRNPKVTEKDEFLEEYRIMRPSGEIRYIMDHSFPIFNDNGTHLGFAGIARDITQKKLDAENIRKAKEKIEIASAAKSEFIANMSHDLRLPMSGIVGMLGGLMLAMENAEMKIKTGHCSSEEYQSLFDDLLAKTKEYITVAKLSSDQLVNLFNEILETTCLESGKFEAKPIAFNLKSLIDKNVLLLQSAAKHKGISLSYTIEKNVPLYLNGIAHCIDRSLSNLLSNALTFTQEGSVKITASALVSKKYQPGDAVTLQLKVCDTGIGIPEDKFDEIFQHFSRLSSSYHGIYKGSGLGLYTVKQYLKTLNGTVNVESKVGEGSCFTLTLPLEVTKLKDITTELEEEQPQPTSVMTNISSSQSFITSKNKSAKDEAERIHILLVEDQPIAAMGIRVLFEIFDCVVDVAENGQMAVDKAAQHDYDLIFMDVGLPDFEGTEATRRIRALPNKQRASVTILGLTGHANDPEKRQECLNASMQDTLSKPLQKLTLEQTLAKWIKQTVP